MVWQAPSPWTRNGHYHAVGHEHGGVRLLAAPVAAAEAALPAESHAAVVEQVRLALIAALQARSPS